jgi:hypothetical protein
MRDMKKYYRGLTRGEYPIYNGKEGRLTGSVTYDVGTAF